MGIFIEKNVSVNYIGDPFRLIQIEGSGRSFFFTCVLENAGIEKDVSVPSAKKRVEHQNGKKLRLLLDEDDAISRMLVEKFAMRKDWTVIVAKNGKEVIDVFQLSSFDVIVMDVQIPVINGYIATKVIRQLESKSHMHTPIIAMTAYALKGNREKCLEAGMDDHLSKPIDSY